MDSGAESYRRFLMGDETGLTDIVREYRDGLTLYLVKLTGDIFAAEEIMEQVFFTLVAKKPRFSGKSSFKTWLYIIGRNAALDAARRRRHLADAPPEDIPEALAEEESVERDYLRQERRMAVHRAMKKLPPQYREALYLAYFEGMTAAETAAVMKKSRHQTENLLYRARAALRDELKKEGIDCYEEL